MRLCFIFAAFQIVLNKSSTSSVATIEVESSVSLIKMMKILRVLLLFGSIFILRCNCEVERVNISCQYTRTSYWDFLGNLNSCYGAEVEVFNRESEVNNTVKSNDIQAILFTFRSKLHFMPAKMKDNYPKLRALLFQGQPMESLSKFDLKQFGSDLEYFDMQGFRLRYITQDLFIYNPNIMCIKFHGNSLKYIDVKFFENIPRMRKLEMISLVSDPCVDIKLLRKEFPNKWVQNCSDSASRTLSEANERLALERYKRSLKPSISKPTNSSKLSGMKPKNISAVDCDCVLINSRELQCEIHVEAENCSIDHVSLSRTNDTISANSSTSVIEILRIENKLMMYMPMNFGLIFSNLKALILNSTGLVKVGVKDFSEAMKKLRTLVLANNLLEDIPVDTFANLVTLENLDISFNHLTVFDSLTVQNMKKLKYLNLRGNRLVIISDNIIDVLPYVEHVDLRDNFCIDLEYKENDRSDIITKLESNCFTSANYACEFSNSTFRIPHLKTRSLKMKVVCEKEIYTEIMYSLVISNQNISLIPYKLDETFPNLIKLVVNHSQLVRLTSESFKGLEQLQTLNITHNKITSIEENVFNDQAALEVLDLSSNEITKLPDKVFVPLVSLKQLNLSNNKIVRFYASFLLLENQIEYIDIGRNKIEFFESDILKYLENCNTIILSENVCVDHVYSPAKSSDMVRDLNKLYAKIYKCDVKLS